MKQKKSLKGHTLGEMATVVAIIGTLTAVAAPNYLRIKMEINMEMVQHELRMIQKNMKDLYTRTRAYPQDINTLGTSDEERAITASLTAVDRREYTTDDYEPDQNLVGYNFNTCPSNVGVSGDKCFNLNQLGITVGPLLGGRAPDPWDGTNAPLAAVMFVTQDGFPSDTFSNSYTRDQQIANFSSWLEMIAIKSYIHRGALTAMNVIADDSKIPSVILTVTQEVREKINEAIPSVYDSLNDKGMQMYTLTQTKEEVIGNNPAAEDYINKHYSADVFPDSDGKVLQLGFKLDSSIKPEGYYGRAKRHSPTYIPLG